MAPLLTACHYPNLHTISTGGACGRIKPGLERGTAVRNPRNASNLVIKPAKAGDRGSTTNQSLSPAFAGSPHHRQYYPGFRWATPLSTLGYILPRTTCAQNRSVHFVKKFG